MPEYITDDIEISSDDSDEENSMKRTLMKKIKYRKNYSRMRLVFIF